MAEGKSKDFAKGTQSDKVLRDKTISGSCVDPEPNYQLPNELCGQIIRKFTDEKFVRHLETIFGVFI